MKSTKYIDTDMDVEILENFEGSPEMLKTDEMGYVTGRWIAQRAVQPVYRVFPY